MKKFALMFAALSLCACTFTACGDDGDDSPSKAKKGESCEKVECDTGLTCNDSKVCEEAAAAAKAKKGESCEKVECDTGLKCNDSKICEEDAAAAKAKKGESCEKVECDTGLKCNDSKVCEEDAAGAKAKKGEACEKTDDCDTGLKCNDSKVCEEDVASTEKAKKGESCEILDCEDGLICDDNKKCIEKPKGKAGDHCEKTEDCEDGLVCDGEADSKTCKKADTDVECSIDTDCTDSAKPYCGKDNKCVAEKPAEEACGTCSEGVCKINICVTDSMMQDNAECDKYSDDAFFCNDDVFWYCKDGKRAHEDCKSSGYGSCSRYHDSQGFTAQCTGTEEMRAHCVGETAMLCDPEGIDKYKCVKDVKGEVMAIYDGDSTTATACANGCEYDGDGTPKCK